MMMDTHSEKSLLRSEIEELIISMMHRCEEARNTLFHLRHKLWIEEGLEDEKDSIQELSKLLGSNIKRDVGTLASKMDQNRRNNQRL